MKTVTLGRRKYCTENKQRINRAAQIVSARLNMNRRLLTRVINNTYSTGSGSTVRGLKIARKLSLVGYNSYVEVL